MKNLNWLYVLLAILFTQNSSFSYESSLRDLLTLESARLPVIDYNPGRNQYQLLMYSNPDALKDFLRINRSSEVLDGQHFRIIDGETEDPVHLSDLDGRNVMYHLEKAQEFFSRLVPQNAALAKKITVRVHMINSYNEITHFAKAPLFNDSAYYHADYKNRWGSEIWFHKRKTTFDKISLYEHLVVDGVSAAVAPGILIATDLPFLIDDSVNTGMDLAKEPSVIYHEAFHWATDANDLFGDRRYERNPITEDYANYFAAVIHGRPKINDLSEFTDHKRVRSFVKVKAFSKTEFMMEKAHNLIPSMQNYNFSNFLPSLLWAIRKKMKYPDDFDLSVWNSIYAMNVHTKPSEVLPLILSSMKALGTFSDSEVLL